MITVAVSATLLIALVSWVSTGIVRRYAITTKSYDEPNERSSHTVPTPRGGGAGIVAVSIAGFLAASSLGQIDSRLLIALSVGGAAVGMVGFLDDRNGLSAGLRFTVHLCAAFAAIWFLGGIGPIRIGERLVYLGWFGYLIGSVAIAWSINLFNFMDGIDGIAASEAAIVAFGWVLIAVTTGSAHAVPFASLVFGAACLGFLPWNWPPAKIFMGDVGSGYLGYVIGVLTLAATRDSPSAVWVWLILGGVFFVDATVTLVRRAARGERVHQAHRSHAYQQLARRWGSHKRVTVLVLVLDLVWLLPSAFAAILYPRHAPWITLAAVLPIAALTFVVGAGRTERPMGAAKAAKKVGATPAIKT